MSESDRVGQVWRLPLSSTGSAVADGEEYVPCLIVGERVELVQPKMSEYRSEKRVPCTVFDVVVLSSGKQRVWYAHVPLEQEYGVSRVS